VNPRLVLPLRSIRPSGLSRDGLVVDVRLWVCKDLRFEDHLDAYQPIPFRIDTGSTHTTMAMSLALENEITIPRRRSVASARTAGGRRSDVTAEGSLLVKFVGLEAHPFVIPCVFVEDRPTDLPGLLGLNALQTERGPYLRFTLDGTPQPDMPQGCVVIDFIPRPA
jgi:hypothetical protein